jgi:hypothetical protein
LLVVALTTIVAPLVSSPGPASAENRIVLRPEIEAIHAGFDGVFKLGCWTELRVATKGLMLSRGGEPTFEISAPDSDGIPATTASSGNVVPFRLGQESGAITARLLDDVGVEQATRTFYPGRAADAGGYPTALAPTARLVITFGAATDLAADLAHADNEALPGADVHSVLVKNAASLPTAWYGYESADTVILSGAAFKAYADAEQLAPRIAALNRWVELGGRLVIFCGADSSELLAEGALLAPLLPGRYSGEVVRCLTTRRSRRSPVRRARSAARAAAIACASHVSSMRRVASSRKAPPRRRSCFVHVEALARSPLSRSIPRPNQSPVGRIARVFCDSVSAGRRPRRTRLAIVNVLHPPRPI